MLSNEYKIIDSHHFFTEVATQPNLADQAILDHFYTGLGFAAILLPLILAIGLNRWEKYQQQRPLRHHHQGDRSFPPASPLTPQQEYLERIWRMGDRERDRLNRQRAQLEQVWQNSPTEQTKT